MTNGQCCICGDDKKVDIKTNLCNKCIDVDFDEALDDVKDVVAKEIKK